MVDRRKGDERGKNVEERARARRVEAKRRAKREKNRKGLTICVLAIAVSYSFAKTILAPRWEKKCVSCCDAIGVPPADVRSSGICRDGSTLRVLADLMPSSTCDEVCNRDDVSPAFAVPDWVRVGGNTPFANFESLTEDGATLYDPVIILNSPALNWTAIDKWTPTYIQSVMPLLSGVKRTRDGSRVFVYEDMTRALSAIHKSRIEVSDMNTNDFFKSTRPAYFSQNFKEWETLLGSDVSPRDFMVIPDGDVSEARLWMSNDDVIAGFHYDSYHNVFAQVRGCKRFIVGRASEHAKMKLYPFHHPNDRQSQLETSLGNLPKEADRPDVFIADLLPGDLLYLPPFTFHRVAAFPCRGADHSVSLNMWTSKSAISRLNEDLEAIIPSAFKTVEPAAENAGEKEKLAAKERSVHLAHYLSIALSDVRVNPHGLSTLIDRIVTHRLSPFLPCDKWQKDRCPDFPATEIDGSIAQQAHAIGDIFASSDADESEKEIILSDFIERIVNMVVGTSWACPFLRCVDHFY